MVSIEKVLVSMNLDVYEHAVMFIRSNMVHIFSEYSTMNEDYIHNLTFSETYLSASDCLQHSLIDGII